jgi:hypothetical protein
MGTRNRVWLAALLAVLALLVVRTVRVAREWFLVPSGFATQRWGCPGGLVEFDKGCYDPKGKVYTSGKQIVTERVMNEYSDDVLADLTKEEIRAGGVF